MNDKRYFVSVIIPVYNGESFIMEALESVLRQDCLPKEIIVVDDGSTDQTAKILSDLPGGIRYFRQKNQGPASARNRGILTAKEPILAFLDIDDLWVPNKLSTQINYMAQHPEIQYTIANFKYFLEKGCDPPPGFKKELLEGSHVGRLMGTLVARKTVFDQIGLFDTTFKTAEDVDWFSRTNDRQIAMAVLPQVLLHKRVHDKNISLNADKNNVNLLKALRQSVQRKKQTTDSQKEER